MCCSVSGDGCPEVAGGRGSNVTVEFCAEGHGSGFTRDFIGGAFDEGAAVDACKDGGD